MNDNDVIDVDEIYDDVDDNIDDRNTIIIDGVEKELPEGFELIREKKDVYSVRDKSSKKVVYICKYCGEVMERPFDIPKHMKKCPKKSEYDTQEISSNKHTHDTDFQSQSYSRPLTPEEEEILEKREKLKSMLLYAPGVGDKKRVEWVCNVFENTEQLRKSPEALYYYIKEQFPKMNPKDIEYIVKSIFNINTNVSTDVPFFAKNESINKPDFDIPTMANEPPIPRMNYGDSNTTLEWIMRQLISMLKENATKTYISEDEIKRAREEGRREAEIEFYKLKIEELESKLDAVLTGKIKLHQTGRTQWDVAQDVIQNIATIAERGISEIGRLTRLITAIVIGKKSGMTNDEIYNLVKSENPELIGEE